MIIKREWIKRKGKVYYTHYKCVGYFLLGIIPLFISTKELEK